MQSNRLKVAVDWWKIIPVILKILRLNKAFSVCVEMRLNMLWQVSVRAVAKRISINLMKLCYAPKIKVFCVHSVKHFAKRINWPHNRSVKQHYFVKLFQILPTVRIHCSFVRPHVKTLVFAQNKLIRIAFKHCFAWFVYFSVYYNRKVVKEWLKSVKQRRHIVVCVTLRIIEEENAQALWIFQNHVISRFTFNYL